MGRVEWNRETPWTCGRCGYIVDYTDEPPEVCPECGYVHGQRDWRYIPEEVKLRLSRSGN